MTDETKPTHFGVTHPDEREVTVCNWIISGEVKSVQPAEEGRPYLFVPYDMAAMFERVAGEQGWKIEKAGYDDNLNRYTYRLIECPKPAMKGMDMMNPRDLAMFHNRLKRKNRKRWPIGDEVKAEGLDGVRRAAQLAKAKMEANGEDALNAGGLAVNAGRVLVAMEGQNQADDHQDEKNERLDAGLSTENVAHTLKRYIIDADTEGKV